MKRLIVLLALSLSLGTAQAQGDPAAGKAKSTTCAACHGPTGNASIPTYPKLCGQHAPYLESALQAYKSRARAGGQAPVMYGMVANLSDQDIADLAAYFSQQSCE